jgi:hypothetical protein
MNESEARSIADVAATLRAEIISGKYSGNDEAGKARKVPSRLAIGERFGLSAESGGVVLRMLAAEGLIRMMQGRGTYAEPVQPFRAVVTVRRRDAAAPTAKWAEDFAAQLGKLREADLSAPDVVAAVAGADIALTVTARDAGFAGARASAVVREMLSAWEITGTLVSPA